MQTHRIRERDETSDRHASGLPTAFGVALALAAAGMIWLFPPISSASNLHPTEPVETQVNVVSTTGEVDLSGPITAPVQANEPLSESYLAAMNR